MKKQLINVKEKNNESEREQMKDLTIRQNNKKKMEEKHEGGI